MSTLGIRALGPLEVVSDGAPVAMSAAQQRVVLECLALRANAVVSSDFLVEAVWRGNPPAKPGPQLQVYVANLRRVLDPERPKGEPSKRIVSRLGGYVLTVNNDELDLLRFRELVAAGGLEVQAGDLVEGADCLRQAVALFKGSVFPDLADLELFRPELDALEETRLDAYQDLIDVELALGRHNAIVGELQSLVAQQPYRERLWASLVLSLYRSDRQADALAACRDARSVFAGELGIDPGPRLRELERLVFQQDASLAAPSLNGSRRIRPRLDNLPVALTPMVGRESELDEVCRLFAADACRLVSITGPGGTGKTRLALAAASKLQARETDGVCWVDLVPLTLAEQVPATLAAALGLEDPGGTDPMRVVTSFLRSRRMLVIFDNFEHLPDAWHVVVNLLTTAPDVRILTTSRHPLGLRAEHEYQLAPLALPPQDLWIPPELLQEIPAVKLFLTRGRSVRPDWSLNTVNGEIVARLCRRLDGLPLAIELAAAQLRQRSESEVLSDLEVSLSSLQAAFRDLPDRQRTLTATIAWSYRLLGVSERALFDELGVFSADPTLTAVSRVHGSSPEEEENVEAMLRALAGHSMLRLYSDSGGAIRVSMLQPMKEYARNCISSRSDAADVRRRHAEFFLDLGRAFGPELWGPDQVEAFRVLHADALDLRGALIWAAGPDGSTELGLHLFGQLWHYFELAETLSEPCQIAQELLAAKGNVSPALTAPALSGTATLCWLLGRNDVANKLHHQALDAFRTAGNDEGVAWTTMCLAVQAAELNDMDTAQGLAAQALAHPHASPRTRVAALIVLERLAFYSGDFDRASELSREGVALARQLGDRWLVAIAVANLADGLEQSGDYDSAEALLCEAMRAGLELGAQGNIVVFLESAARLYVEQHRIELASRVLASADAYRIDHGHPLNVSERPRVDATKSKARMDAGPIGFALAWAAGQALTITQMATELIHSRNLGGHQEIASVPSLLGTVSGQVAISAAPWS